MKRITTFTISCTFLFAVSCGENIEDQDDLNETSIEDTLNSEEFTSLSELEIIGNIDFENELNTFVLATQNKSLDENMPYKIELESCAKPLIQKRKTKLTIGNLVLKFKKDEPLSVDGFDLTLDEVSPINLFILTINRFMHDACVNYNNLMQLSFYDGNITTNEMTLLTNAATDLKSLRVDYLSFENELKMANSKEEVLAIANSVPEKTLRIETVDANLDQAKKELDQD